MTRDTIESIIILVVGFWTIISIDWIAALYRQLHQTEADLLASSEAIIQMKRYCAAGNRAYAEMSSKLYVSRTALWSIIHQNNRQATFEIWAKKIAQDAFDRTDAR
jgi:hypothetical protein